MSRLPVFFSVPHRVMFLAGTVQAILAMSFWSLQTGGHYAGLWTPPAWPLLAQIPPAQLHALLLAAGVFPFFVFGFILTAGPRWQGAGDLALLEFLPAFLLLACGWLLVWISLLLPLVLASGLAIAVGGWVAVAVTLTRLARRRAEQREHIICVAAAAWFGAAALGAFAAFAGGGPPSLARAGTSLAIWGFLLPVFLTVAHRMLPFFTSAVVRGYVVHRPAWALRLLLGASLGHAVLATCDLPSWLWLADVPAALAAGRLTWLWWQPGVMDNRMVAVLHVAFAWVAPAFALHALQSTLGWAMPGVLGQAALHALTVGFFASMLIGMASRVTLGHSGRPVATDAVMWRAFCLMQVAAALRVLSDLPGVPAGHLVMWISSAFWLGAFAMWAWRFAPFFWRPRTDGKAG